MLRLIIALDIVLVTTLACVTTNFIPDDQLNGMGEQAYAEIKQKEKLSTNAAINDQVGRISKRIAAASGEDFDWEFVVIDNPKMVNAFCLPGGKIAVYTGILPVAQNEAALAAIIGHEVAHATKRHGGARMSQGLIQQAILLGGTLALGDAKYRNEIMLAFGLGSQGMILKYSRDHEREADLVGLRFSAQAGYDPREVVPLWRRMAQLSGGKEPPVFMSTHPQSEERAQTLDSQMPEMMPIYESGQMQPNKPLVLK